MVEVVIGVEEKYYERWLWYIVCSCDDFKLGLTLPVKDPY